jgi:hypothetical protein
VKVVAFVACFSKQSQLRKFLEKGILRFGGRKGENTGGTHSGWLRRSPNWLRCANCAGSNHDPPRSAPASDPKKQTQVANLRHRGGHARTRLHQEASALS